MNRNFKKTVLFAIALKTAAFICFMLVIGTTANKIATEGAYYNWDMLGYIACALSFDNSNTTQIHQQAYAEAKKVVAKKKWSKFSKGGFYRRTNYKNQETFNKQLAFYRSRIIYTGTIYLLSKCGISIGKATAYISVVCYLLIGILIFWWSIKRLPVGFALIVSLCLAMSKPLVDTARYSTPDEMCVLFLLSALFAFIEFKQAKLASIILIATLFVRPDSILFGLPFCFALGFLAQPEYRLKLNWAIALSLSMVLLYFITGAVADSRPWWVVFQFTLVKMTPFVDQIDTSFNFKTYFEVVQKGFNRMWGSSLFVHIGLATLGFYVAKHKQPWFKLSAEAIVMGSLIFCLVTRFLLFPRAWDRLFAPYYTSVLVVFVAIIASAALNNIHKLKSKPKQLSL